MTDAARPETALPRIREIHVGHLLVALAAGWEDFRAAPRFGLFFASIYVSAGLVLTQMGAGLFTWTLTLSLGFPLIAPFLAVGLYEVSRRLEQGRQLTFPAILSVVWAERTRQIPWAGAVIAIYFLFWSFFAHMLFALIMGPSAFLGPPETFAAYLSGPGLTLVVAELGFGAVFAFLLFALTAMALPMLLDREVDFVTAMLTSLAVVRQNLGVMLCWAALIGSTSR
jgi:uncharacterized membrane protein